MDEKRQSPPSQVGQSSEELALLVWRAMQDLFGPLWSNGFGQTPTSGWRAALAGLSAEEIRRGLRATAESGDRHPPTAPQFRARCRPGSNQERAFAARIGEPYRAALPLPEKMAYKSRIGRQWLAYWYIRGIRRRPNYISMDDLDEMLGDADLSKMDAQVAGCTKNILHSLRIHDPVRWAYRDR